MSGDAPMRIDLSRVAIIARKEFADHLTDRTFLLVLALFGILTVLALHDGLASYASSLQWYALQLEAMKAAVPPSIPPNSPYIPSTMYILLAPRENFLLFGPVLAIAVGFDLISGERTTRSLRMLLVRPVFRDEVITGKAVGGAAVLALASAVPFILALGAMLVAGFTVTPYAAVMVVLFWGATVLYLLAYFAVAVAFSGFAEDGGRALAWAMAVFILFSTAVPTAAGYAAGLAAGPLPEPLPEDALPEGMQSYLEEQSRYYGTYNGVRNAVLALSPNSNYEGMYETVVEVLVDYHGEDAVTHAPGELLDRLWQNVVALVAFPAIFLAVAYVRFMRIDLR
ncbi:ABC-2 type transport system permease protein [Methanoculleus thermophilus]|uniref:ABC-2 type transport system permease protein n=2 Tax=Methanoculleus thermophilus TaxID=2200 RepID=A0A1G8X3N9_9EURY|nr:ABC-2 type transport system permease protein [Methanoculleus thermophilus]